MTTPQHAQDNWDDSLEVTRALESLDQAVEVPTVPLDATDPFSPQVPATQPEHVPPVDTMRATEPREQTVLRRKRPVRRTDGDDGRTLRRDPRARRKTVNAVPSPQYAPEAMPAPPATGRFLLEYKPLEAGINICKDDFSYYILKPDGSIEGKNGQKFSPDEILETMQHISHAQ